MSIRQPLSKLKKADEIKVDYKDIKRLYDLIEEKILNPIIYIYISKDEKVDWEEIETFKGIFNIKIAVEDAFKFQEIKDLNYFVFWSYPITSYWELNGIIELGACEVLIDAPLFFDLKKVKTICEKNNVEIRVVANQCFNSYMPRNPKTGIYGPYIRPEDVDFYERYIDHIEFITKSLEKELTLIKVYKQDKTWPGNLNLLLDNLGENVDNRGFDARFAKNRTTCGQRCQIDNSCHFCHMMFNYINTVDKNRTYLNETYGSIS